MFDPPNIVRVAVVIYVVLGGIAAYSLWRNAGAPDALQHSGIIIAGLLPALIAVLPYLQRNELEDQFNFVIIFDEDAKQVLPLGNLGFYTFAYGDMYSNLDQTEFTSREINHDEIQEGNAKQYWPFFHKETGFDLIERLVLIAFASKFQSNWDIEFRTSSSPFGTGSEGRYGGSLSDQIQIRELAQRYEHNRLIRERWMDIVPPWFHVPAGASVSIVSDGRNRGFEIRNSKAELKIDITPNLAGELQGIWGQYLPQDTNWASLGYRVRITMKYRKYSPDGQTYERWFTNAVEAFRQYDWAALEERRNEELQRQHLETN